MTTPRSSLLALAAVAAIASAGCGGGDGASVEESIATNGTPALVDWDTFRASAREIPNEGFLVEDDLLFRTEAELYDYWQRELAGGPGEALTVHTVGVGGVDDIWGFPQNFNLTYCVSNGFTSAQMSALLPALDAAADAWQRFLAVQFKRVTVSGTCDKNNNQVVFNFQPNDFTNGFYPSNERKERVINVDNTGTANAFTNTDTFGRDLLSTLTHELGHALGLVHEHIWNPTCSADDPFTEELQANSRQLTEYDQMSVMNYPIKWCRDPPGGGNHISPLDISGTVSLYGLAPALVDTVTADY